MLRYGVINLNHRCFSCHVAERMALFSRKLQHLTKRWSKQTFCPLSIYFSHRLLLSLPIWDISQVNNLDENDCLMLYNTLPRNVNVQICLSRGGQKYLSCIWPQALTISICHRSLSDTSCIVRNSLLPKLKDNPWRTALLPFAIWTPQISSAVGMVPLELTPPYTAV